jgi:hypothetical protein
LLASNNQASKGERILNHNFRQRVCRGRNQSGLALLTLVTFTAIFVVAPLVLTVYEIVQYNFCQLQLKHCVESAALAAGCGLTASTSASVSLNESYAMNQALCIFQKNTIMGVPLTTATYSYAQNPGNITNTGVTVTAGQAKLYFEFIDPYTGNQDGYGGTPVQNGAGQSIALNTAGKIIRTIGYFGFVPEFAKPIGLGMVYPVVAQADGGMPQLDMVFCFDISQSMDDFTDIVLVNRYGNCTDSVQSTTVAQGAKWDVAGYVGYTCVNCGQLNQVLGDYSAGQDPNFVGCSVNAGYPQLLDSCSTCAYQPNIQGHGWTYDVQPYYDQSDPTFSTEMPANKYTDLVVPLDGNNQATAVTVYLHDSLNPVGSYTFPAGMQGIAVMVEAQRSNLEDSSGAVESGVHLYKKSGLYLAGTSAAGIQPGYGWFQAYYSAVMGVIDQQNPLNASLNTCIYYGNGGIFSYSAPVSANGLNPQPLRHPIGDVICAVENFFQALWNDADVHFGLVVYNDEVGGYTNSNGNVADPTIYSGAPDTVSGNYQTFTPGSPTPGAADYQASPSTGQTGPQENIYLTLHSINLYNPNNYNGGIAPGGSPSTAPNVSGYVFTNPNPPDRTLIPLPQLLLQKSPGPTLSASLFDTTIPPGTPTPFASVNYALYNYAAGMPNTNPAANLQCVPYCLTPFGGCNITNAINAAVAQFSSASAGGGQRLGSTPAIVLFTDGIPAAPDTASLAAAAAQQASRTGSNLQAIPIYTVGLAALPGVATAQASCLQNISSASGIGATSFQVDVSSSATALQTSASSPWNPLNTNSAAQQLDVVFQNLARQLVCLVN